MLIFTIIWLYIVCGSWFRSGWTHRWTQSDGRSGPVWIKVELFLARWLPPRPSVLHCVSREESQRSMRLCWFPQSGSMRSPRQDKQTRKGENSCRNLSLKSQLDKERLALARKTKRLGVKLFLRCSVLCFKTKQNKKKGINVLGLWAAKPWLMIKSFSLRATWCCCTLQLHGSASNSVWMESCSVKPINSSCHLAKQWHSLQVIQLSEAQHFRRNNVTHTHFGCFFWLIHCFSSSKSRLSYSGEAFNCRRYLSAVPGTSASRRGDVSPVICSNKLLKDVGGTKKKKALKIMSNFFFPGLQICTSVWTRASVSFPAQWPSPLWAVWVV